MSLLDDAIREHLELMRRRGADAAEVARAEREALGPSPDAEEDARLTAEAAGIIPAEPPAEPVADPAGQETQILAPEDAPARDLFVEEPDFGRDAAASTSAPSAPAIEANDEPDVGESTEEEPSAVAELPPEAAERASQETVAFSPDDVAAASAPEVAVEPEPAPVAEVEVKPEPVPEP